MAESATFELGVPQAVIKVDGSSLPPEQMDRMVMLSVKLDLEIASSFEIHLRQEGPESEETVKPDPFKVGSAVEIDIGTVESEPVRVIKGEVVALEPILPSGTEATLRVRGYDKLHRLTREKKTRTFIDVKHSDVAQTIAGDSGLTAKAGGTSVVHKHIYQNNQTDLEFLRGLADRNGYHVWVDEDDLFFDAPKVSGGGASTLKLEKDLLQTQLDVSLMAQPTKVIVRGWDPKEKKEIVGKAELGSFPSLGGKSGGEFAKKIGDASKRVSGINVTSQAEADEIAKSVLQDASYRFVQGSAKCRSLPELKVGGLVDLEGLGGMFSGKYLVTRATHIMTPTESATIFEFVSDSLKTGEQPEIMPAPPPPEEETQEIEIEFKDQDGNPVSGLDFLLKLPDGEEREGTLGDDGIVKADNLPKGKVTVTFAEEEEEEVQSDAGSGSDSTADSSTASKTTSKKKT